MNVSTDAHLLARIAMRSRRRAVGLALAVLVGGLGLTGCGIISKVKSAVGTAERNKATMESFTNKIQAGPTTFEATYVTTGSSPQPSSTRYSPRTGSRSPTRRRDPAPPTGPASSSSS